VHDTVFVLRRALSLLVGLVVTTTAAAAVVPLNERSNGSTVRVHVGDTVVVTLVANASTGYAWKFTSTGGRVLHVVSARYVPPPTKPGHPLVGAPGKFVARLSVRNAGRAKLALAYVRHTHPATPPARRFAVTIAGSRG
jgi:inhibitor of cysteine peptidase